ncbi:hypothetical protein AXF42_Ash001728 [Apostasia shenzhenica]|uniref:Uncharacterized protein n=1 Tax=Apostasia shenzhenica TaxID=1088818 RepID=A0A2I0AB18_9ASPA|nr:hypothetical protein AXF42_Ash001728 [Apostasia shenzhenica]
MTINASKCFNGILRPARGLPIQALMCVTYYHIVGLFFKRQEKVESLKQSRSTYLVSA